MSREYRVVKKWGQAPFLFEKEKMEAKMKKWSLAPFY
jgi:hypothetical protein